MIERKKESERRTEGVRDAESCACERGEREKRKERRGGEREKVQGSFSLCIKWLNAMRIAAT
jgi:hypothetical protein